MEVYSRKEELANSITHGVGVVLSLAALVILVADNGIQGDLWKIISLSVYGATLILMYTASTLYHSFFTVNVKQYFKIFDHSAIYLLIAGTYTPFTLIMLPGTTGLILFCVIWCLALAGIVFKVFFTGRFKILSTLIYLFMGWLVIGAFKPMVEHVPEGGLYWLMAGGLLYSLGVIFYLWKRIPYQHAIWHLFVLGGSICHFFAILLYVAPA